ncbi:MAG: DUF4838 domain-containing protein [Ferruginibacter sp.]|nr:DUF4838 domain-containing protein [Ferruginibacter sp.]
MKGLLYVIVFCISTQAQAQNVVYYTPVSLPKPFEDNYYAVLQPEILAKDAAALLGRATGQTFSVRPYRGETRGVFLLLDSTLISENHESGWVQQSATAVVIRARYATGLSYALYSWMHQWGFRFYLPTDAWIHIPAIQTIYVPTNDTVYAPSFKLRMFGASGGNFAVEGLDPNQQFRNDWFTFYRRNRMGSDYLRIDGHMGEKFNLAHREDIEKDTSILAPVNGVRKYNLSGKLDPTYAKGVQLFVRFIVNRYKTEQQTFPEFLPFKKYMSVDPGDGLHYCETPACRKAFPTISDQMFYIAKETLKALQQENPIAGVSTLAYSERTDTPVARIPTGIHTMVVPGAFQTITTPAEMMYRWSKKTAAFSQYDFLNIGVWAYDHPFFNLSQYAKHIHYLKRINADGISMESTQSAFASGIPTWYILQQYADSSLQPEAAIRQMCRDMFEGAAEPVEKIFKLFYFSEAHLKTQLDRPAFYADELGAIIHYTKEAARVPQVSDAVQFRIFQLKGYVLYLCKFYELFHSIQHREQMDKGQLNRAAVADNLLQLVWQMYDYRILHYTQINDLLKKLVADPDTWNYRKNDYACFKGNHRKNIERAFDTLSTHYPHQPHRYILNDDMFKILAASTADSLRFMTQDEEAFKSFTYAIPLYAPIACTITIKYVTGKNGIILNQPAQYALMGIEGNDYTYMEHHFVRRTLDSGTVTFYLPAGGHYKLYLAQYQSTPVQWVVHPGGSLLYLNKKALPHNGILLQDEPGSVYDNAYISIFKPLSGKPGYRLSHYSSKNTIKLYNEKGMLLKTDERLSPHLLSVEAEGGSEILYFTNTVRRWPPVFYYTEPYVFFLKKPGMNTAEIKKPF